MKIKDSFLEYHFLDDIVGLRPGGISRMLPKSASFGKTTNTNQTATEIKAQNATFEQIQRDFAKKLDAELFKLMTQGTLSVLDYSTLHAATYICVDCGNPYILPTYNMTRDLPTTHCPSCEDAQKEAAGLK